MLNAFRDILCSKLCWHNRPGPTVGNVAAFKYCHHCAVNVAAIVSNAAADIMLLSLCVNIAYVLVITCDVAASKCHHHCGINIAVTVCSAPVYCCYCCTCCMYVSHCM